MTEMEQILERLTRLEQSVAALTELVRAGLSQPARATYAVRARAAEAEAPTTTAATSRPIVETDHPLIIKIEGVRGGAPITRYAGVSVHILIGWIRIGESLAQIREGYPHLSTAELCEAFSYYLHHPEEIDAILAKHEAANARSLELSRLATERKRAEHNP